MDIKSLLKMAEEAARQSYCPYSDFPVGAALLCSDGTIFLGTNIENRSFGLTNCAERSAIFTALSEGKRCFTAMAVVGLRSKTPLSPCGACRQVLSEFVDQDFSLFFAGKDLNYVSTTMKELLPYDTLHDLRNKRSTE